MRIKLDENLPDSLVPALASLGHDAETCAQEGIAGTGDQSIFAHACAERRTFVTCDKDFCDIRKYPLGTHSGIILLRVHSHEFRVVHAAMVRVFAKITDAEVHGNLVVASALKVRVRRQ